MRTAYLTLLAVVPWVAVTLLVRYLVKMGDETWPVGLVGFLSRIITLLLLVAWVLGTGSGWRRLRPRGNGTRLVVMGVLAILINLAWFAAPQWTTGTNMAMLTRLDILFVIVIGASLGLERIGLAQLLLLPFMLFGLGLLIEIQEATWQGHILGDTMMVFAALALAVNAFVIRRILRVMDEESVAVVNHGFGTVGFLGLALAGGDFSRLDALLHNSTACIGVAVLGVLTALSLPLYYVALKRMPVWKLRMCLLSAPVMCAMVEWPLWGMELTGLQCVGAIIILAGLAMLIHLESRQPADELTVESTPNETTYDPPDLVVETPQLLDSLSTHERNGT